MTTRILVCDDERDGFESTKEALGEHDAEGLVGNDLKGAMRTLFDAIRGLLPGRSRQAADESLLCRVRRVRRGAARFKDFDVIILDNNLSALDFDGQRLTAEAMIGYLRGFTDVPYIVSLNKNPDVDFDLRYMLGDHQTFADLALNTKHLGYEALWQHGLNVERDMFAPSYWPNLNDVHVRRRELTAAIEDCVEKPVLDVLGFPPGALDGLSRHAKGVLSHRADTDQQMREVTCKDFFKISCRSLPQGDRDDLLAACREAPDLCAIYVARLVAAELDRWVRRDALGPQDVLVDLPHLLVRMPFLLGRDAEDIRNWNRVLDGASASDEDDLRLLSVDAKTKACIEDARFRTPGVYTRWGCFWWHRLRDDDELNELFFNCEHKWADAVFCEDTSRFVEIARTDGEDGGVVAESPREFQAEFGGAWSRRHIQELEKVQYSPRSRLAV